MHVRKRVRTVIQVLGSDRGTVIGKSTDDHQLTVKGTPPSVPLTNFVEVIGIADSEKSIQAEIWTNFGDTFGKTFFSAPDYLPNVALGQVAYLLHCF